MCAHPALSVRTLYPVVSMCGVATRACGVVTLTLERTPEPGGGWRACPVCVRLSPSKVSTVLTVAPSVAVSRVSPRSRRRRRGRRVCAVRTRRRQMCGRDTHALKPE